MINAVFYLKDDSFFGFTITGHAGFANYGNDIVCSAVTSAVELTANGITEIVKHPCKIDAVDNCVSLELHGFSNEACMFLKALRLHLELLATDYPKCIKVLDKIE